MQNILQIAGLFLVLALTMGINQEDNLLARLDMTGNHLALTGLAFSAALLLSGRQFTVAAVAVLLSLATNMPVEYSLGGLDRDYYCGFLVVVLLHPVIERLT